mmetsp:Transcript_67769/g.176352  ORF Transcript_67769/g.176352 Transcript_67769/m.176352 type:complete len:280 (+) Transcript_67769:128-967(+)
MMNSLGSQVPRLSEAGCAGGSQLLHSPPALRERLQQRTRRRAVGVDGHPPQYLHHGLVWLARRTAEELKVHLPHLDAQGGADGPRLPGLVQRAPQRLPRLGRRVRLRLQSARLPTPPRLREEGTHGLALAVWPRRAAPPDNRLIKDVVIELLPSQRVHGDLHGDRLLEHVQDVRIHRLVRHQNGSRPALAATHEVADRRVPRGHLAGERPGRLDGVALQELLVRLQLAQPRDVRVRDGLDPAADQDGVVDRPAVWPRVQDVPGHDLLHRVLRLARAGAA